MVQNWHAYQHRCKLMESPSASGSDATLPRWKSRYQSGFTLIEIAIVMAIIGMVMLLGLDMGEVGASTKV